jgi:hypothetical protein
MFTYWELPQQNQIKKFKFLEDIYLINFKKHQIK